MLTSRVLIIRHQKDLSLSEDPVSLAHLAPQNVADEQATRNFSQKRAALVKAIRKIDVTPVIRYLQPASDACI
jgi:hypothetical protein